MTGNFGKGTKKGRKTSARKRVVRPKRRGQHLKGTDVVLPVPELEDVESDKYGGLQGSSIMPSTSAQGSFSGYDSASAHGPPVDSDDSSDSDSTTPEMTAATVHSGDSHLDFEVDSSLPEMDVLNQLILKVNSNQFRGWKPIVGSKAVHFLWLSSSQFKAIQREIVFFFSGNTQIGIHCAPLPVSEHERYLQGTHPPVNLTKETLDQFVNRCFQVTQKMHQYSICIGANHEITEAIWSTVPDSYRDDNPYFETDYVKTCRSTSCLKLVPLGKKVLRCPPCANIMRSLKARAPAVSKERASSTTPNIYLTPAQAQEKLRAQHEDLRKAAKRISYLENKVSQLLSSEGVNLDEDVSEELHEILFNHKDLTDLQKVFIKQQLEASSDPDGKGHRWHPAIIRLALHIQMVSRSAYDALRDSGVLKLPSTRTLYNYSHCISTQEGIQSGLVKMCSQKVEKLPNDYQKFHALLVDEVHLSKNLVWSTDGHLIGYVHLDKVDEEMKKFENAIKNATGAEADSRENEPILATKMLAFMIKSLCGGDVKCVIAAYPCTDLTKEMLYIRSWDVISVLEMAGIRVLAYICDGNAVNRAFFNMHEPTTKTAGVVFDTINWCSPDRRPLYFVSDVCHLVKTARNCFYQSGTGPKKTRLLQVNNERIQWNTIVRLYNAKKGDTFRKSYKLTPQHVFLNSFSVMNVKIAAQVLSDTVASDIEDQGWPETKETVKFLRNFNTFFDCLNGAHSAQSLKTRNKNLAPYTSQDDERFKWLESFLEYLDDWKQQSSNLGLDAKETPKTMLSQQTLDGIKISVLSITAATKYLLGKGAKFVMARAFSQDPLEQHFSLQRSGLGGSTSPNAQQFFRKQVSLAVQGSLGVRKRRANVQDDDERMSILQEPLPKRSKRSH